MPGPAMSILTVLTATLVLLAWQPVSDSMAGPAVSLFTVLTATLGLLAWQQVSDSMGGPVMSLLTVLTVTLVLLAWQEVSDFMPPGPAVPLLTGVLTATLVLLDWQFVSGVHCAKSSYVPFHWPHCHSAPVGFTGCEWFHARSSCVSSYCCHYCSWWSWQLVSDFISGWVMSLPSAHYSHCHPGPVNLIESELFHADIFFLMLTCHHYQIIECEFF